MKNLTSSQKSDLISRFVELIVDGMDTKTLAQYVTDDLEHFYENKCDDNELEQFINNYDESLLNELIDDVTTPTTTKEDTTND